MVVLGLIVAVFVHILAVQELNVLGMLSSLCLTRGAIPLRMLLLPYFHISLEPSPFSGDVLLYEVGFGHQLFHQAFDISVNLVAVHCNLW